MELDGTANCRVRGWTNGLFPVPLKEEKFDPREAAAIRCPQVGLLRVVVLAMHLLSGIHRSARSSLHSSKLEHPYRGAHARDASEGNWLGDLAGSWAGGRVRFYEPLSDAMGRTQIAVGIFEVAWCEKVCFAVLGLAIFCGSGD
ncbi:unnamed protein product [Tuber aestivum]|uniref:Uncharacterized protein n=1 Tax=Tuber aestivum TaxID=59557 RepID=A0A292Q151_9PEZI|nr:unnamed protein product [Tuber aestivum]